MRTVGVVSLGAMGSAVGSSLIRGGARVVATLAERSQRTVRLAERTRVELLPDLAAVVRDADVVLSIVPPEAAATVAQEIAVVADEQSADPVLVELNAVAPETARAIEAAAAKFGVEVVDGSISGPPPRTAGTTRVYLSGARAEEIAALPFDGVDRIVVGREVGSASAVKMSTASVYKGTTAILAQALLTAERNGVLDHVLADLLTGSPELVANVERRLASAAAKSGRYVGEMHEIAAAQAAAGLTPALFEALADVFGALANTRLAQADPESLPSELGVAEVLGELL